MISEPTGRNHLPAAALPGAEPTLADLMSRVAQRLSFNAAAVACAVSIVALAVLLAFAPSLWRLALAMTAMVCASAWAMSDHERRASVPGAALARRWRVVQVVSSVFGVAAVFALLLALLSSALGLWIS